MKDLTPDHPVVQALIAANRRIDTVMAELSVVSMLALAIWALS